MMREWPQTLTISPPSCIGTSRGQVLSRKPTTTCTLTGTPPRCSTTSQSLEFAETDMFSKCAYDYQYERTTKERLPLEESILIYQLEPVLYVIYSIPLNLMYALQRIKDMTHRFCLCDQDTPC